MEYYAPTQVKPNSKEAGVICQLVADNTDTCGYPDCEMPSVGCAVHKAIIEKPDKKGYDMQSSKFLPVCEKHRRWEFAKVSGVNPWDID